MKRGVLGVAVKFDFNGKSEQVASIFLSCNAAHHCNVKQFRRRFSASDPSGNAMGGSSVKRFTDNTAAARLLRNMFVTDQVTGKEKPSDVRALHEEFKKFDASQFAAKFRKFRELHAKGTYIIAIYSLYRFC